MPVNDSDAWHELVTRFKALERETEGRLYALWISSSCDESGDWHTGGKWQIGGSDDPALVSFQRAAERGTVLHRGSGGEDALSYWLDLVRTQSAEYKNWRPTSATNSEEVDLGRIENVCKESAEYCYQLETAAIADAHKANQNGPPRVTVPAMPAIYTTETLPSSAGTAEAPLEPARPQRKKRGRGRPAISDELKQQALGIKGGKERAKILYGTKYPTVQQVKNVPNILKHFNRKRQPKAE